MTASTPSLALVVGGLGGLLFPGLQGALMARAGESVLRGSLFKTGYEIFFTPIEAQDKRAAKSIIDVGFDRLGEAVGWSGRRRCSWRCRLATHRSGSCSPPWRARPPRCSRRCV